jgi:hypothetical protein
MHNPEVLTSLGLPQGIKNINLINDLRMKMGFLPLGLPALKRVKNASFFPISGDRKLPGRHLKLGRENTLKTYQNPPQSAAMPPRLVFRRRRLKYTDPICIFSVMNSLSWS